MRLDITWTLNLTDDLSVFQVRIIVKYPSIKAFNTDLDYTFNFKSHFMRLKYENISLMDIYMHILAKMISKCIR